MNDHYQKPKRRNLLRSLVWSSLLGAAALGIFAAYKYRDDQLKNLEQAHARTKTVHYTPPEHLQGEWENYVVELRKADARGYSYGAPIWLDSQPTNFIDTPDIRYTNDIASRLEEWRENEKKNCGGFHEVELVFDDAETDKIIGVIVRQCRVGSDLNCPVLNLDQILNGK
jgi:hypothetical protein